MGVELLRGHLRLVLLAALDDGPTHGYALIAALREGSGSLIDLNESAVYPLLHRLEAERLVASHAKVVGGRNRRVYELTAKGRRVLEREAAEWRRFAAAVDEVVRRVPWLKAS